MGRVKGASIIDAIVMASAAQRGDSVLASGCRRSNSPEGVLSYGSRRRGLDPGLWGASQGAMALRIAMRLKMIAAAPLGAASQ